MNFIVNFLILLFFANSTISKEIDKKKKYVFTNEIDQLNFKSSAKIRILNKIISKIEEIKIEVNKEVIFDRLKIIVRKCWKAPLGDKIENKVFLEIYQINKEDNPIFKGWMFSSSPSISSLEHPIYDIDIIGCE